MRTWILGSPNLPPAAIERAALCLLFNDMEMGCADTPVVRRLNVLGHRAED
jgi:hypothetical protein